MTDAASNGCQKLVTGIFSDGASVERASDELLRQYEADIHDGGILVGVKTCSPGDARRLAEQWLAIGGQHVDA